MGELDGLGYRDATVVVTGASSGMGDATVRILGDLGARVHAVDVKDGYSVSKEMLIVYAMHSSIALGERQIRINCTAPCPTNTAFMKPTMAALATEFFERYPYPVLGRMDHTRGTGVAAGPPEQQPQRRGLRHRPLHRPGFHGRSVDGLARHLRPDGQGRGLTAAAAMGGRGSMCEKITT